MAARLHNVLAHPRGGWTGEEEENVLRIGLLNNMPDGALERTERQFGQLLAAAAPELHIRWYLFSLRSVPRSTDGNLHLLRQYYGGLPDLFRTQLDAVIVTGTEPRQPDLRQEPYWPELAQVFDWIHSDWRPALFSCLAAHAAVLYFDGVERQRLSAKRFGLFQHHVGTTHALTSAVSGPVQVAHSRWNEIPADTLAASGYTILTHAPDAGPDLFVRRDRSDVLYFQGHPEYEADTLAREYRRDVRRYLLEYADCYPQLPQAYFSQAETDMLTRFREQALTGRDERLMDSFPLITRRGKHEPSSMAPVVGAWLRQIDLAKQERSGTLRSHPIACAS